MTQGERLTTVETSLYGTNGDKGFIDESREFHKETREFMKTISEYISRGHVDTCFFLRDKERKKQEEESMAIKNNNKVLFSKIKWLTTDRIIIILLALINVFTFVKGVLP